MMDLRIGRAVCAAALLAGGIAFLPMEAQAQDTSFAPADLIEAANAEGELTVYSTLNVEAMGATADAFMKVFPDIKVTSLRLTSIPMYARIQAEFESGVFEPDLVGTADVRTFTDHPEWWVPMTTELVPTLDALPPEGKGEIYMIATQSVNAIAYNTNVFTAETAPKSWTDIIDPSLKGRGLFVDPRGSAPHQTWIDFLATKLGDDYLTKLKEQEFPIVASAGPGAQEVAAGGADFAFPVSHGHIAELVEKGAPIALILPWEHSDIPATGSLQHWALSSHAKHPNAARLFLTWLLTPDGAKVNCDNGTSASLILPEDDLGPCLPYVKDLLVTRPVPEERLKHIYSLLGLE